MGKRLFTPNEHQIAALREYAEAAGSEWRKQLRKDWMRAGSRLVDVETYTFLHQLRNEPGFDLAKFEASF